MSRRIYRLDQFGLSLSAFRALGGTPVTISVQQRGPDVSTLRPYPPARRVRKMGNGCFQVWQRYGICGEEKS